MKLKLILAIILIVESINSIHAGKCPPVSMNPCICQEALSKIVCSGYAPLDLKKIFENLTKELEPEDRHFKKFVLSNKVIEEIGENAFGGLTFESIDISSATRLSRIHVHAFEGTKKTISRFSSYMFNSNLGSSPPDFDLFSVVSSFPNAERIWLGGDKITEIPDLAFKPRKSTGSKQLKLVELALGGTDFTSKLGENAFSELDNLNELYLFNLKLNYLGKNAFQFSKSSTQKLVINLGNNPLNASSFEAGVFVNSNRPLELNLYEHKIEYLDEQIFRPFFEANPLNEISDFYGRTFSCFHCKNEWLLEFRESLNLANRVRNMRCNDYSNKRFNGPRKVMKFWNLKQSDFANCDKSKN